MLKITVLYDEGERDWFFVLDDGSKGDLPTGEIPDVESEAQAIAYVRDIYPDAHIVNEPDMTEANEKLRKMIDDHKSRR